MNINIDRSKIVDADVELVSTTIEPDMTNVKIAQKIEERSIYDMIGHEFTIHFDSVNGFSLTR